MEDMHINRIAGIALTIFRVWIKNAEIYYPDMDFTFVDKTKLMNNLEQEFRTAFILTYEK